MTIALAFGLQWLLGFLLVRWLWPAGQLAGSRVLRASLAVGIGAGLTSVVWFLHLVLLGAAHQANVLAVELVLLSALAFANRRRAADTAVVPAAADRERGAGLAALALGITATAALIAFALATLANPHGVADALTIWNSRALLLFDSGTAWRRVFDGPALHHADYPPLVPIAVARAWQYGNDTSPVVPAMNGGAFLFAAAGVCWGALRVVRGSVAAFASAALLLASPAWVAVGAMQYADVPIAFFTGTTIALLALHARHPDGRGLLWLAGAAMGCAAWTKNEGVLFAVVVPVAVLALGRRALRPAARDVLHLLLGALPWLLALVVWKCSLPFANDLVAQVAAGKVWGRLGDAERWLTVARGLARCAWSLGPGLIVAAALWLGTHRRDCLRLPFAVAGLLLLGYFATYLTTSVNLDWHIATSGQRLCLQVLPVALLAVFSGRPAAPSGN